MAFGTVTQGLKFILDVDDKATAKLHTAAQNTKKSLGDAADETSRFGGAIDNLAARSPLVAGALDRVGVSGTQAASVIGTALPGAALAAGGALVAFGVHAFNSFQDLAGAVLNFQRVSGATADEASRFVAVLDDYQISAEQGSTAIGKMAKAAANTPEVFARFGVEIAKNKDGTVDLIGTLENAAETYANTSDASTKAALGAALFGKGYQTLIPILEKGKDGADGLASALNGVSGAQIVNQRQIDQAEDTRLALDRLHDAVHDISLTIGSSLSPAVEVLADDLSGFVETANKALGPVGGLAEAFGLWAKTLSPLATGIKFASDHFLTQKETLDGLGPLVTGIIEKNKEAASAQADMAEATKRTNQALIDGKIAVDNATQANTDAVKAINDHRDAILKLNDAMNDGISATLDKQQAERDYASATLDSNAAVADYNKTMADSKAKADDRTKAGIDLEDTLNDEANKFVDVAQKTAEANGETFTAIDRAKAFNAGLEVLKGRFPELAGLIDGYQLNLSEIPTEVKTDAQADATTANAVVDDYQQNIGEIPGTVSTTAHANVDDAIADVQRFRNAVDKIPDTVTVHGTFVGNVHAPGAGTAIGGTFEDGQVRHAATGVTFLHTGENGPEDIAVFGADGRVLSRSDTVEARRPKGGGPTVNIGPVYLGQEVDIDIFARRLRFALASA